MYLGAARCAGCGYGLRQQVVGEGADSPVRVSCLDRTDGLQVFGEIGNTFSLAIMLPEVNLRNPVVAEVYVHLSALGGRSQCNRVTSERLRYSIVLASIGDDAAIASCGQSPVRRTRSEEAAQGSCACWRGSLKSERMRPGTPLSLEDARNLR